MIAAHEGELHGLAGMVAHDLERVIHCLRAADVEMHPALDAVFFFDIGANRFRQLDLFLVQVLAGKLRQGVDLALEFIVEALVLVAEVDRGIPHLQV